MNARKSARRKRNNSRRQPTRSNPGRSAVRRRPGWEPPPRRRPRHYLRYTRNAVIAVVLVFVLLVSLAVPFVVGRPLVALAEGWPGPPISYTASGVGLSMAAALVALLAFGADAEEAKLPRRLRAMLGPRPRVVAAGAGVVWMLTLMVGINAVSPSSFVDGTRRGGPPERCADAWLGCWLEVEAPAARVQTLVIWIVGTLLVLVLAGVLLAGSSTETWTSVGSAGLVILAIGGLVGVLLLGGAQGERLAAFAVGWPGGAPGFMVTLGVLVFLGPAVSLWAGRRGVSPGWAVYAPAGVIASLAALLLITALPPKDRYYQGSYSCERGFYCHLDKAIDSPGQAVAMGWATPLLLLLAVIVWNRANYRHRQDR